MGVVIEIGTWKLGTKKYPNESITMLTSEKEFVEVWIEDVSVISRIESDDKYISHNWNTFGETCYY